MLWQKDQIFFRLKELASVTMKKFQIINHANPRILIVKCNLNRSLYHALTKPTILYHFPEMLLSIVFITSIM